MFLRTLVLQLTFFLALAAAARLGTTVLAGGWSIFNPLPLVYYHAAGTFFCCPLLSTPCDTYSVSHPAPACSSQHRGAAVGRHFLRSGWFCSSRHRAGQPAVRLCTQRAPAAGGS